MGFNNVKLAGLSGLVVATTFTVLLTSCGGATTDVSDSELFNGGGDGGSAATPTPDPVDPSPSPGPVDPTPSPGVSVPTPTPSSGDPQNGKLLYESSQFACAICHGDDGQSVAFKAIDAEAETYGHSQAPGVQYDLATYLEEWMPPTNRGACDASCAQDIEAYIRTWVEGTPQPSPSPVPPTSSPLPTIEPSPAPTPTPVGVVTLYQNCNFGGYTVSLAMGSYSASELVSLGARDNDISSVKVETGYQITLYQDDASAGASVSKTSDDSCLINDGFNDLTSSIVVSLADSGPPEPSPVPEPSPEPTPSAVPTPSPEPTIAPTPSPSPVASPSPAPEPTPSPEPLDCSDMQTFMQQPELNCTNSSCHAATPSQAAKISLTGSLDDLALRFADVGSVNSNCAGEKIIDVANPSNSLLLKIIDPNSGSQCATKMPIGSAGVSPKHFQCFEQWIDDIVTLAEIPEPSPTPNFVPASPLSALNKTKNLLHGGAVTEEELSEVSPSGVIINQAALKAMIEEWMGTDEFEKKFKSFLQLALQQKNVNADAVYRAQFDVIASNRKPLSASKMYENFETSFVRTAYRFVENGQDFRNIATTRDWEVTTALLLAMSYADYENRLPFREGDELNELYNFSHLCGDETDEAGCEGIDDYADWRTVTLTQGTTPAVFEFSQDLAEDLRAVGDGGNYAYLAPRVGFFTTPVFFQSWESNVGNKFRVTANQAMIVGLGLSFEAGDITPSGDLTALDDAHAGEDNPECYACHRMLDPMRQVFDNVYQVSRSRALTSPKSIPAAFAFHGGQAELATLDDLGQAIFDHPNFAKGWVGKLCNWATSAPCEESSTEFLRLVDVFKNSGFQLKPLVVELFSSPLVTGVEYIDAFASSAPAIVLNRTNHFCKSMQARLSQVRDSQGLPASPNADICAITATARAKANLLPQDEFARGGIDLIQSVNFDPFLTTGYKQLCEAVGNSVVSYGAGIEGNANYNKIFSANFEDRSIDEMTTYVMGIPPSSTGYADTRAALQKVYDIHNHSTSCEEEGLDVIEANADEVVCGFAGNKAVALRQVWNIACSSPTAMGMGF